VPAFNPLPPKNLPKTFESEGFCHDGTTPPGRTSLTTRHCHEYRITARHNEVPEPGRLLDASDFFE
jgi:hypothetical protein